jgi:hypothetical protein
MSMFERGGCFRRQADQGMVLGELRFGGVGGLVLGVVRKLEFDGIEVLWRERVQLLLWMWEASPKDECRCLPICQITQTTENIPS